MSTDLRASAGKILHTLGAHQEFARQFFHPAVRRPVARKSGRSPVLFYSQVAWDTVWQRPQEQAIGLSRHRPVVFVSPVQLHEVPARLRDRFAFCRRLEGGRLTVLSPLILSGEYRSPQIREANRRILRILLRPFVEHDKLIFLTNSPFAAHLVPFLRPRATVYDLIDDFCSFNWAPPDGRAMEDQLVRAATLGLAGTGTLQEQFADRFPELEFLPSGVNFQRMTAPQAEPADIADLPRPRLLYVGTLNDRLNGELFQVLARQHPTGSIVVVGPRHGTFQAPELPPNVHFLGLKPHEALPGYYQHCDMGIMPFADSPAARAINPVKTLEYLACGLPVLSTPVPDVVKYYPGVVRVAEPGEWAMASKELLDGNSEQARTARVDFARNRGWDRLVLQIEQKLRRLEAGF